MKVRVILEGFERIEVEGDPRDVLKRVDEVLVDWKVRWNAEKEGKGR